MDRRLLTALALALVAAVTAFWLPSFSGATFTSSSRSTGSVSAAADWTPPTVSLQNPGSTVNGTVALTAVAADGETGVKDVVIQYLPENGSAWTTICTDATTPYTCAWNTTGLTDGSHALRAIATDNAGYTTTSATVTTIVANRTLVVLADPGEVVRGTVTTSVSIANGGLAVYSVTTQYAVAGSGNWKTLCSSLVLPSYSCTWSTTGFANGGYDLRAVATSGLSSYTSAVIPDVLVDNLAPTVAATVPGSPLRGVVTLAATATDDHSGVSRVTLQHAVAGSTTWRDACVLTEEPFSCRFDTTTLVTGTSYSFRAVAVDLAGNSTTSTVITNRLVDNSVSSVSVEDPGAFLKGSVTVTANANSTAGVTSVRLQRATAGTTTWTDLCTDTAAPYSCAWDTTGVTDGLYDLRALLVDGLGNVTTSATVGSRRVDNSPLRGADVQTVSGGVSPGRLDTGDALVLSYSAQVDLGTVTAGWNGAAQAVTLTLRDGNLLGLGGRGDTLEVSRAGAAVNLGSVNLREDYIRSRKTAVFAATMTATTAQVNGATVTVVRITVGTQTSGTKPRSGTATGAMVWTPSAAVKGLTGLACSAAPVTEPGAADREW